jgi:hypothetical protein
MLGCEDDLNLLAFAPILRPQQSGLARVGRSVKGLLASDCAPFVSRPTGVKSTKRGRGDVENNAIPKVGGGAGIRKNTYLKENDPTTYRESPGTR